MTVAPIGGRVEHMDCDERVNSGIQAAADILAFQSRRVIQERDEEMQKKR